MTERHDSLNRRSLMGYGLGALSFATASTNMFVPANARMLADQDSSLNRLKRRVKLLGSLEQSVVYTSFSGTLWGIAPARAPMEICGFQGLARSDWAPQNDGSFEQHSFDIGYFSDLDTGKPLQKLLNPFTTEEVEPFHYRYGGNKTSYSEQMAKKEPKSESWSKLGNNVWLNERSGGEFPAPFSPSKWPRESAGKTYFYGTETSYATELDQLENNQLARAEYTLFWSSFLSWEPWLLMDGKPGFVHWRGVGAKLKSINDVPAPMRAYIDKIQPNYFDSDIPWSGRASTYESYKKIRKPASLR